MKKYTKPEVAKVKLNAGEAVLQACKIPPGIGQTPCVDAAGYPLLELGS